MKRRGEDEGRGKERRWERIGEEERRRREERKGEEKGAEERKHS